ncbi:MAG: hypothetical protein V1911_04425, partial [Candidatus Micrarchaeota archaeon]
NKGSSERNFKIALEEYQKTVKLTQRELNSLQTYLKLAHAMHLLEANFSKVHDSNNSEENEYWLSQGRAGLKQMLSISE